MIDHPIRRRDVFKRGIRFRPAISGQFVTRLWAFLHPRETVSERIDR